MDRREFFRIKRNKASFDSNHSTETLPRVFSDLSPYTGAWSDKEVAHLLKRTMFGAKKADIDYFKRMTVSQAVDELLNPVAPSPQPPVKDYAASPANANNPDTNILQGTTWVNDINNDAVVNGQRRQSYKKWLTGVMINQDRSILEKLTMFWTDHFGNETIAVRNGSFVYRQHLLIRNNALGNFKDLVFNMSKDLGMLVYLNGENNTAAAPDENYARELMELFTLGKGPGSQYTEDDVKAAAKVLTGWFVNRNTWAVQFLAGRHSTDNKSFSSFFNNTVITGRTGATAGDLELTDLLNMIFLKDEVAKFIVRKIYRWFVYYAIDATTEANVITPLAAIFRNNNYEIKPVLEALFNSAHFFDVLNTGCMIKTPADLVIGSLREMNVSFSSPSDWDINYPLWNIFFQWMSKMGQDLHDPPNVSGMPAYYQAPVYYEIWINADSLPKRNQFTDIMISTGYTRNSFKVQFDCVAFAKQLSNPGDPNILIDESLAILYQNELTLQSKTQIKIQILLSGQITDSYWTNAWAAYIANPSAANFNTVNTRLKSFYQYVFNLSEYQLA